MLPIMALGPSLSCDIYTITIVYMQPLYRRSFCSNRNSVRLRRLQVSPTDLFTGTSSAEHVLPNVLLIERPLSDNRLH
jgi:hypothetical protein